MKKNQGGPSPPFGIRNAATKNPTALVPDEIYMNCLQEKNQHEIAYYLFSPEQFKQYWNKFTKQPDRLRAMRNMVQIGTIHTCLRGKYFLPNGESVLVDKRLLERSIKSTIMYQNDQGCKLIKPFDTPANIHIIHGDCLEAALWLKNTIGCNPVCLNMASRSHPGGGYRNGAGAQEENLHRRTNLFQCLDDPYLSNPSKSWSYPLPEFGGIYVPNAMVFRRAEEHGYAFLERPDTMSFVCVFAYSNPPLENNDRGELVLSGKIVNDTKKKIETIFNIAKDQGHDSIVLSAFGCGAYCNPPKHIAQLFKEVLKSKYSHIFNHVVFSIFDDHNTGQEHNPEGNISAFSQVFEVEPITLPINI